ncbi:restriction endonuclease subunit S [Clostridium sp.]|uniref:restriction endonuclease subunit S n=1 Tax=Clostridium sp. TaxID=1506 RepID=UPI0026308A43|nr:restriction endonuclease subunit S [Clostridium sp.]
MNKNVPKLRFKGFEDEWKDISLGNLLEFKNGVNADKEAYGEGIKFINVLDILNNNFITYENIIGRVDIDKDVLEKYSVNYGDIVFQRSSETREEVGTANVYLDEQQATFGGFVIRGKKIGEYNPMFMNGLLKSSYARKEIVTKAGGSTRYNVGQDILSSVNIKLPSLQEQEKIANFLSKVDSIIEKQEKKVEYWNSYKKGMIQKIFKQEIRFKDDNGLDYPEWEEKKLGEITDIGTGSNDLQDKDNNGLYPFFVRSKNIERINQYTFDGEAILIPGDGNIGQIYHYINGKFAYHQRVYKISGFKKGVLGKYIYFYMSKFFLKEALKNSVKATVDSLRLPTLTGMLIKLPVLEEQEKIANFLSNIDNIIEKENKKLEELRQLKKGLLQQMFI